MIKAIVGGTVGLVVGTMTCAPLTGMVGGAFIAQAGVSEPESV